MKNETEGSVLLVMSNKTKSPNHAISIGELARRPEVEEVKVKGKYLQDSARPPYSRRAASVERKGTGHPRRSKTKRNEGAIKLELAAQTR